MDGGKIHQEESHWATNGNGVHKKEVTIPFPDGFDVESVVDNIIAGWTLLLQRYQRDAFLQFTWGYKEVDRSTVQTITAAQLNLGGVSNSNDLLKVVRNMRSRKMAVDSVPNPKLVFNDGTEDDWTFQATLELHSDYICATPEWKLPAMSEHQSIVQLRTLSSILIERFFPPNEPISEILETTSSELDQLWSWNTPVPPSLDTCMHDIIWEQAQLNPDKIAIESWDGNLTYAEVDQFSTELAQILLFLFDSPKPIVPLLFEKCRWTIVAVLAAMKTGASFALLDPAQPEGRLHTIVEQTDAKLILASKTQAVIGSHIFPSATIIPISESKFFNVYRPFALRQPNHTLPLVDPSSPLYIQFTSGSTGLPKGVLISHSQYTSGAIPRAHAIGYRSHSRVLDFASYAFDVSIDSMLCTLAHGGTLCTPSEERRINDLCGVMREMKVTFAGLTPSVVRVLDSDVLSGLETLACGGESPSSSDIAAWSKKTRVANAYGPSECTVGATINNDLNGKLYATLGQGTGCVTWAVDPADHNKLVPPGAVGELLIEGPIVGIGYLNNLAKTAEVYIEDPAFLLAGSKNTPGRRGRLYKTGDHVRYDPDGRGELVFVGRGDQQVKLRGQRVELAEIEFNMAKHLPPGTEVAAEAIKPSGKGEPTLVAFIAEAKDNSTRNLDGDAFSAFSKPFQKSLVGMARHLSIDLPVYMAPSAYIPLWKMPLLVSCKTDRKRLREIGTSISRQELRRFAAMIAEKQEPKTEMERRLQSLWGKVLGLEADFGSGENFFRVGGDSLRAMRLVAAAREEGISLTVGHAMLHPMLSAMAKHAIPLSADVQAEVAPFSLIPQDWKATEAQAEIAKLCGVDAFFVEDAYPCTPLQEGLMALSAKFADAYVAQRVVELPIEVAQRLQAAFERVIADCAVLRTRIVNVSGRGLLQAVVKQGITARSASDLQAYLKADREDTMDLGTPLFRYAIITTLDSQKAHFIISQHHAVYDGWSFPLMVDRLNQAFQGAALSPRTPFKNFIKFVASSERSESEHFWRQQLHGASPYQFPPLPQKGYITKADSLLEHYVAVPPSSQSKHTLATIIRGSWALVASLYLNTQDTVFGETLTGRSAPVPGIEQIEGPMITTIPFRVNANHNQSVSTYLDHLHEQSVHQMPHEHLGLQHIRRLGPDARQACDLRTGLVLHPKEDPVDGKYIDLLKEPATGFVPTDNEEAAREALKFNTYALMLVCTLDASGFLVMASFDKNCVAVSPMGRVLSVFAKVVKAFYAAPDKKIGEVLALGDEEKADAETLRVNITPVDSPMQEAVEKIKGLTNGNSEIDDSANSQTVIKLKDLLSRILSIPTEEISPSDSFFELGGESIGAMRLVSEARTQGLKVTVAQIFQTRSLSALASLIGNEKEKMIRDLLSNILSIPKEEISSTDSFFELGGDSIGAMRLVYEARTQGLKLSVAMIFQCRSLSELASKAEEAVANQAIDVPFAALGDDANTITLDVVHPLLGDQDWKIADIYPARPLQHLAVDGTVELPRYSLRYELIQFSEAIEDSKLLQACQDLVVRNEVLRTVFVEHNNRCLGVALESLQVPMETSLVPEGEDLMAFAIEFANTDIVKPKPYGTSFVAFTLFKSSISSSSCLAFRISHAQYDEMCLPLLFAQLAALYKGVEVPESRPFTKHVNHAVLNSIPLSIPYWKNLLAGSSMSVFKPAIPLTNRKATFRYRDFNISNRPAEITIATLPTAAWAVVLANRIAKRDLVFGEVVSGRNIDCPSADRIVGPTWQYIPMRIKFQAGWTYSDLLYHIQNQHIESAAFESMGLSEIVTNCTDWDPKEITWFDTVVHQAPAWVESMDFGGLEAKFETLYPHAESLREWKCQAFIMKDKIRIEIVTFEEWIEVGEELLGELGEVFGKLMGGGEGTIFGDTHNAPAVNGEQGGAIAAPQSLGDFEGVM
ncbi:nonribosomal peptide synthetase 6 [Amniculicola lignicola CBS 123094]|uniref:Nonribosomal peptide synthetase 6 n=1 Tax=Amniculicola lignicola CBS 123094 TaxID=1392246 RepID=A0A6A5VZU2_9PLEO|nr:nonribosomal peptide synthetase 6 [Amniculicola lignicola CBS 123094]